MDLSKVKLVVSDMDGTLLNSKGEVSALFFDLFKKLQKQNILFCAASGRQYHSIVNKLATIKDEIYVIAENGAIAKKGDEVLVPAMTHTATSHAVEYVGATPKFVDIEMFNGTISIESLKKNITKKTKAIIIVHMSGYPCKMKEILQICKKNKIKLIEDCAHAVGTKYNSRHAGLFGMTGCFSFYPTKQ